MARSTINETIALSNTGSAIPNAHVTVKNADGSLATVYADFAGAEVLSQPLLTSAEGRIPGWLENGSYSLDAEPAPGGVLFATDPIVFQIINGDEFVSLLSSAATSTQLADHVSDTTDVHGIADTSRLITQDNIGTFAPPPDLSGLVTLSPATITRNVIQPTTDTIPLTVRGMATQTQDLQRWQTSGGVSAMRLTNGATATTLILRSAVGQANGTYFMQMEDSAGAAKVRFDADGALMLMGQGRAVAGLNAPAAQILGSGSGIASAQLAVRPATAAAPGIIVQGATGQTGDLQQWQSPVGANNARITQAGSFINTSVTLSSGGTSTFNDAATIKTGTASIVPLTVQGTVGQSTDLQRWQDSTSAILAKLANNGYATFYSGAQFLPLGATSVPLIAKGAVAQTADLFQAQDSAGVVKASVDEFGKVMADSFNAAATGTGMVLEQYAVRRSTAGARLLFGTGGATGIDLDYQGGGANYPVGLRVNASQAGNVPLVAKAVASQTASIQEWQDATGSAMAKIDANGNYQSGTGKSVRAQFFHDATITNAYLDSQANTGGFMAVARATNQVPFSTKGFTGQTSDLVQLQDSTGVKQFYVSPTGTTSATGYFSSLSSGAGFRQYASGGGQPDFEVSAANIYLGSGSAAGDVRLLRNGVGTLQLQGAGAATDTKFIIKNVAAQAQNPFEVRDSANVMLTAIDVGGGLGVPNATAAGNSVFYAKVAGDTGRRIQILGDGRLIWGLATYTGATADVGLTHTAAGALMVQGISPATDTTFIARALATQTANIQEWQSNGGGVLSSVDSTGRGIFKGASLTPAAAANSGLAITGLAAGTGPLLRATANATQTGNLAEFVNTAGSTTLVNSFGDFRSGWSDAVRIYGDGRLGVAQQIISPATTAIPLVLQGILSQTAPLLEVRDSTGASLAEIQAGGQLGVNFFRARGGGVNRIDLNGGTVYGTTLLSTAAGAVGTVVKGFTGQTADLQQWQDPASAVLHAITSAGRPKWAAAALVQTTVGAAGAASAPPTTPTKYLQVVDNAGTVLVVPAYAAS